MQTATPKITVSDDQPRPHFPLSPRSWIPRLTMAALLLLTGALGAPPGADAAASGSLSISPGHQAVRTMAGALTDGTATATFTVPANRPVWMAVQLRSSGASEGYRARARVSANGTVSVGFSRVRGAVEKVLSSKGTSLRVKAGTRLNVEGSVTGSSSVRLAVRAWVAGSTMPRWQQFMTDPSTSRLTKPGPVLAWAYLSRTATRRASVPFTLAKVFKSGTQPAGPASSPEGSGEHPNGASTGVPAGTKLTRHMGTIKVRRAGTVINGLDIHGFVIVQAPNVTIRNSIVRGGHATGRPVGLITDYGFKNLVIENVDINAEYPSVYFDGIKGSNFTARRVHVVGNVDSIKIHGSNVTVEDSLLENTKYYKHDPQQGGSHTHNDNIQILRGTDLRIVGNTIRGATGFAILGGAEKSNVRLYANGNWLDGGHCTVKLQTRNGYTESATVTDNKFGPDRGDPTCPFTAYPSVKLTASGNRFLRSGAPVPVLRVVS